MCFPMVFPQPGSVFPSAEQPGLVCAEQGARGRGLSAARPATMPRHGVAAESAGGHHPARNRPQCESSDGAAREDNGAVGGVGWPASVVGRVLLGRQGGVARWRQRGILIARRGIWIAVLCMLHGTPCCRIVWCAVATLCLPTCPAPQN